MDNVRRRLSGILFGLSHLSELGRVAAVPYAAFLMIGAVALIAQAPQGLAQKPSPPGGTTAPARPAYATTAFDPTMESLPQSYAGMDCVRTIAALKRAKLTKSEFETTDAYEKRKTEILGGLTLYGGITADDILAFKVELQRQYKPSYDADNETLSLDLQDRDGQNGYLSAIFGRSPDFDMRQYVPATVLSSSTSSYLGSNAFGARTLVRKETGSLCGVIRGDFGSDWIDTDATKVSGKGDVRFRIASADARVFLRRPAMLVIGRLDTPYLMTGGLDVHGPTRDEPYDRVISVDGVVLKLVAIWYYDSRSGRVFYKQQVNTK